MPHENTEPGRDERSSDARNQVPRLLGQLAVRVILLAAIVFGVLGALSVWGHGTLRTYSLEALAVGIVGSFALSYGPQIRRVWNASRRN